MNATSHLKWVAGLPESSRNGQLHRYEGCVSEHKDGSLMIRGCISYGCNWYWDIIIKANMTGVMYQDMLEENLISLANTLPRQAADFNPNETLGRILTSIRETLVTLGVLNMICQQQWYTILHKAIYLHCKAVIANSWKHFPSIHHQKLNFKYIFKYNTQFFFSYLQVKIFILCTYKVHNNKKCLCSVIYIASLYLFL